MIDPDAKRVILSLDEIEGEEFSCIYADPPWVYGNQSTRNAAGNHYAGMHVDEIKAMPVNKIASKNAHLHLWTTNAFLPVSFEIMQEWGFTYKSMFIWVKPQMGMGNYWRVSHEYLLFGMKGKLPFNSRSEKSWASYSRGKHSAKPEEIRHKIERVSNGPYLELFGRMQVPGWTVFGNQIKEDIFND